jgi:hypothetical protein
MSLTCLLVSRSDPCPEVTRVQKCPTSPYGILQWLVEWSFHFIFGEIRNKVRLLRGNSLIRWITHCYEWISRYYFQWFIQNSLHLYLDIVGYGLVTVLIQMNEIDFFFQMPLKHLTLKIMAIFLIYFFIIQKFT